MAPSGAALHRRRRWGEPGRLTLPHRRRRVMRGGGGRGWRLRQRNQLACCRVTPAVAGAARGRPSNHARHPGIGRAVVDAARFARRNRRQRRIRHPAPAPTPGADEPITPPTATIFIDADEWDARAHVLGGTSNTLLTALAARLAQRVGRVTADGSVSLTMPSTSAPPAIPAPTPSRTSTSRSTRTRDDRPAPDPRRNQASADPLSGGARRTVDTTASRSPAA